ncbi:MAG: hypothetical protein V4671_29575, partial [Armatimonadota bacterium]
MTITPSEWKFEKISAALTADGLLTITNRHVERKWRINEAGSLTALSLRDRKSRVEWLTGDESAPSPTPPSSLPDEPREITLTAVIGRAYVIEAPAMTLTLTAAGAEATISYQFKIFDRSSGIIVRVTAPASTDIPAAAGEPGDEPVATGVETADRGAAVSQTPAG